jgi:TRAP-type C4-dicarboxylate transport system permease small subunit
MTLRVGGHIRVVLLLKNAPVSVQRGLEIFSAAAGSPSWRS